MATLALRDREPSRSRLLTGPRPLPSPTIWRFLWPRAASGLMSCGGGDCLQASGDERGHWDALKRTLQGVPATVAALEAGGVSASPPTATASTAPGLEPLRAVAAGGPAERAGAVGAMARRCPRQPERRM